MPSTIAGLDMTVALLLIGSVLSVVLIITVASVGYIVVRPKLQLRNRMRNFELLPVSGDAVVGKVSSRQTRIQKRLKELEDKGKKRGQRNQIRADILQAGYDTSIQNYFIISFIVAILSMVGFYFLDMHWMVMLAGGVMCGFAIPKLYLRFVAARRRKKFTQGFASAIDVLVRGIKSGLPVSECLAIIGREAPEPVGGEFYSLVEGMKMGVSMELLLERGLERMRTPEYKFFAIVLLIQKQTGGNLANTLEGLSTVLRERKKMKDKVKAMSSEAKASAGIIGSLPFFVALMVSAISPDYLVPLYTETIGNYMVFGGFLWMGLGIAVMAKMINFEI